MHPVTFLFFSLSSPSSSTDSADDRDRAMVRLTSPCQPYISEKKERRRKKRERERDRERERERESNEIMCDECERARERKSERASERERKEERERETLSPYR